MEQPLKANSRVENKKIAGNSPIIFIFDSIISLVSLNFRDEVSGDVPCLSQVHFITMFISNHYSSQAKSPCGIMAVSQTNLLKILQEILRIFNFTDNTDFGSFECT